MDRRLDGFAEFLGQRAAFARPRLSLEGIVHLRRRLAWCAFVGVIVRRSVNVSGGCFGHLPGTDRAMGRWFITGHVRLESKQIL